MRLTVLFFLICFSSVTEGQQVISREYRDADSLYRENSNKEAYSIFTGLFTTEENDSLKIEIAVRLGYILSDENRLDSSIYYFKTALSSCEDHKIYFREPGIYNGIGNGYLLKKNFSEAIRYYRLGLAASVNSADSVKIYVSILVLDLKEKKYDSAYILVRDRLGRYKDTTVWYRQFYMDQARGNYFLSIGKYDSALVFLAAAVSDTKNKRLKANVYSDLADTYINLGNYAAAMNYQDSAYAINHDENYGENFLSYFDTYVKLYRRRGDFEKALFYADSARYLSDSLFDADRNKATIEADAKYDNQKALADKAVAEKQSSISQRNFVITFFALAFAALLGLVSLRISRGRKRTNAILTTQKQQVQQLADELAIANNTKARLFSTIGHDLRSPVSSLYALLKMQEVTGAAPAEDMSEHTVNLLDTLEELLVWSKSQTEGFVLQPVTIMVSDLFEELREFYRGAASAAGVNITTDADATLKIVADENILKTILRNALSNAIAHTPRGNTVQVMAHLSDAKTVLSVSNPCTAPAFKKFQESFADAAIKSQAHGFGLVLIKEFAQKIDADVQLSFSDGHAVLAVVL